MSDNFPCAVADEHGYFVKNASNQTFLNDFGEFFCGTIDLTNPDAYQWYKDGKLYPFLPVIKE